MDTLTITAYSVERIKDPFGILEGERFECLLDLEVSDDDDLYIEGGLYARAVYSVKEEEVRLVKYELRAKADDAYLDFELEDDEIAELDAFCRAHLAEAET